MAQKKENSNSSLILLAILLAFLAIVDISTLYIWKISTPTTPSSPEITNAKVVGIIDGNTITISNGQSVRLLGVDSPQQGSSFYQETINALNLLVLNKQVRLEPDTENTDSSGKLLRYVYVDYNGQELFVNKELVRQGYALSFFLEPNIKYRTDLELARKDCLKDKIRLCA